MAYSAVMSVPSDKSSSILSVSQAGTAEMTVALERVFGRLPQPARNLQIAEALAEIERTGGDGQIVLIARRDGNPVGAVWAQIQPGNVTSLWPPGLASSEPAATAAALVDLAVSKAAQAGARLVQSLLETTAKSSAQCLLQCGFKKTTDLLYLVSPLAKLPDSKPSSELVFEPLDTVAATDPKLIRLAKIIQRTYEGTKDCPAVQGVRSADEVLTSYRGVGEFDPSRWFIVCDPNTNHDIGCLLLTEYRQVQNWELVYMGIVPEVRGRHLGLEIVRQAQWLAREANRREEIKTAENSAIQRVVVAVDAANTPAVAMYLAANFEVWDRRSVFLREI